MSRYSIPRFILQFLQYPDSDYGHYQDLHEEDQNAMLCLYQDSQIPSALIPSYFRLLLGPHLTDMTVSHSSSYQRSPQKFFSYS